ncbi:MAG TPA: DUF480 domain-containing protein [Thermoanaerobaculia bacterium]|nr:DUF480 domain-containing protein [Thermoanaerobaculia bacterium]
MKGRLARPLDEIELRVLGCLLEKELSTPDAYPLTHNALLAACNQKSNRDPVLELAAAAVEEALTSLMGEMLAWRVRGARVLRWRHNLGDKWHLGPAEKAVLAELLLRGPQTPGELRSRGERMHRFGALGEVEAVLAAQAAGGDPLVEELPRAAGQKERRWVHRLGDPAARVAPAVAATPRAGSAAAAAGDLAARLERLEERVAELERQLTALRGQGA